MAERRHGWPLREYDFKAPVAISNSRGHYCWRVKSRSAATTSHLKGIRLGTLRESSSRVEYDRQWSRASWQSNLHTSVTAGPYHFVGTPRQQGIVRTKRLLREHVWFPGIYSRVEEAVANCRNCQVSTDQFQLQPLQMQRWVIGIKNGRLRLRWRLTWNKKSNRDYDNDYFFLNFYLSY